jgi:hypothetical protein
MPRYAPRWMRAGASARRSPGCVALERIAELDAIRFLRVHNFAAGFDVHRQIYPLSREHEAPTAELTHVDRHIRETMLEPLGSGRKHLVDVYYEMLMARKPRSDGAARDTRSGRGVLHSELLGSAGIISLLNYGGGRTCVWESALMTDYTWCDHNVWVYGDAGAVRIQFANPFIRNAPTVVTVKRTVGDAPVISTSGFLRLGVPQVVAAFRAVHLRQQRGADKRPGRESRRGARSCDGAGGVMTLSAQTVSDRSAA